MARGFLSPMAAFLLPLRFFFRFRLVLPALRGVDFFGSFLFLFPAFCPLKEILLVSASLSLGAPDSEVVHVSGSFATRSACAYITRLDRRTDVG